MAPADSVWHLRLFNTRAGKFEFTSKQQHVLLQKRKNSVPLKFWKDKASTGQVFSSLAQHIRGRNVLLIQQRSSYCNSWIVQSIKLFATVGNMCFFWFSKNFCVLATVHYFFCALSVINECKVVLLSWTFFRPDVCHLRPRQHWQFDDVWTSKFPWENVEKLLRNSSEKEKFLTTFKFWVFFEDYNVLVKKFALL